MFDSHAHLTDLRFKADLKEVIERAGVSGITGIITVHTGQDSEEAFSELIANHDLIYGAAGAHPEDHNPGNTIKSTEALLKKEKIVALGEIGLDYYYKGNPSRDNQAASFRRQLKIARDNNLPVIIHCREAWEDMLRILEEEKVSRGVMHCFSGDEEKLRICLDLGLYISIAGPVTFPNAHEARRIAGLVPPDRLLVETDCPYLSPQAMRGERNEPSFLKHTIEKIAEVRKCTPEEISRLTEKNTRDLFKI